MYTDRQLAVLKEFAVIDAQGRLTQRKLLRPEDKPLGVGPLLEEKAIRHLLHCDTTEGQIWLEWIFTEAMGGSSAKESSGRALEQMKQRFMDERLHGYQHARTREIYPKLSKEDAEARWALTEPHFVEVLFKADQDSVEKLGVWGFYRHWPGREGIYQRVEAAMTKFLATLPKIRQMNDEIAVEGKERIGTLPANIESVDKMEELVKKTERYFASKKARDDIRLAQWKGNDYIYSDDWIVAVCPLTFAASVRFGCDTWQWSSREQFERTLIDEQAFADAWKANTERNKFYVFLRFKCPVPRWVARRNDKFFVHELTNLCLEFDQKAHRAGNVTRESLIFHDEEGRTTMKFADIVRLIQQEPARLHDDERDMPIKRGQNVYASQAEAEEVIKHFEMALTAIVEWLPHFDTSTIVVDALATVAGT